MAKAPTVPSLLTAAPDARLGHTVYWGEAHTVLRTLGDFEWKGPFEGWPHDRKGLAETVTAPAEGSEWVFPADFLEADLPTAAWLCARLGGRPAGAAADSCVKTLRRSVASPGTLLAYTPCWKDDCPLAELKDGRVTVTTLPALSEVRVVPFKDGPVVLAWSYVTRSPTWIQGRLVVLTLEPPLTRAAEIALSEVDERDPTKVLYWLGALEILDDGVRVRGRRSVKDRASNRELSGSDVDERWTSGAGGLFVKR